MPLQLTAARNFAVDPRELERIRQAVHVARTSGSGYVQRSTYSLGNLVFLPITTDYGAGQGQDATGPGRIVAWQLYDMGRTAPGDPFDWYSEDLVFQGSGQFTDEPGLLAGMLRDPLFYGFLAAAGGMAAFLPGGFAAGEAGVGAGALGDSTAWGYGVPGEVAAGGGALETLAPMALLDPAIAGSALTPLAGGGTSLAGVASSALGLAGKAAGVAATVASIGGAGGGGARPSGAAPAGGVTAMGLDWSTLALIGLGLLGVVFISAKG